MREDANSDMVEPAGQKRILVVEDDESIILGLQMNLEAEGYAVAVATDGDAALASLREEPPALVILDVMLPRMNGFEVLRTLRREGLTLPVIMLSARGAEMDKVMGLELGAEDYITKPFGLADRPPPFRPVLRRIAKYASTWVPHSSATAAMVADDWAIIQEEMAGFGRDPGEMTKVYSNFIHVLAPGEAPERPSARPPSAGR